MDGKIHHVVVVGDLTCEPDGAVTGTRGMHVEVTPIVVDVDQEAITDGVEKAMEARAVIDQSKGMMMALYRIDADTAYRLLRWRSQNANVKLRALAVQVVKDFSEMAFDDTLPQRAEYDHLLMTAHNRASAASDSRAVSHPVSAGVIRHVGR